MNDDGKVIVILGPTASGKTAFGVRLASRIGGEIVSVDSRQLYRGLDIGSGKDIAEYTLPSGETVGHHLIDIAEPDHPYNLAEFMRDCRNAVEKILAEGHVPVLVGGSALYLDAVLHNYSLQGGAPDPVQRAALRALSTEELREKLRVLEPASEILRREPENRTRLIRRIEMLTLPPDEALLSNANAPSEKWRFLVTGVLRDRAEIHCRIETRLDERLASGMLDEARHLHDEKGVSWERLEFFGLEYRYMALHLQGKLSFQEMRDQLLIRIRQFAKRQDSWFRNMERNGIAIHWFRETEFEQALALSRDFLAGKTLPEPAFKLSETFYGPRSRD